MIVEHKTHHNFRQWNCGSCGKLLGLIYHNKTVAIKYKDLMVWVEGSVKTICRFCQTENNYNSNKTIDNLIDEV